MAATPAPVRRTGAATTALLTDRYELTMLDAALESGVAHHRATFEVFARSLPHGRRFGLLAGTGRLLEAIRDFRFDDDVLAWLDDEHVVSPRALEHLDGWTFRGDIDGYAEGETYFAGSPVLTVEADFADAVILETLVLSVLNHDTAVASAAARMVLAAGGKTLIEGGSRRTHEQAAVAAARAAWIAGFDVTSNLAAGKAYGVATGGTAAHAFTLAHASELDAFRAQAARLGEDTTFLVDTFDVAQGVRNAIEATGGRLGGVRIDSGDLAAGVRTARRILDEAGATSARIVASGDLDEHAIAALEAQGAPVDLYLVGTSVVVGSGAPTAELVYKLVAIADRPGPAAVQRAVAKRSVGKAGIGGRKRAWRELDDDGTACGELVVVGDRDGGGGARSRPLQRRLVADGEVLVPLGADGAAEARQHAAATLAELPAAARDLAPGPPAITVRTAT